MWRAVFKMKLLESFCSFVQWIHLYILNTMSTSDLKNNLHRMVVETDDPVILEQIAAMFAALRDEEVDWWDMISEEEKGKIEIGTVQALEGKVVSWETVQQKARQKIRPE